jgi:hypothetical protein
MDENTFAAAERNSENQIASELGELSELAAKNWQHHN